MGLNMYIKYMLLFFREIDELNFQFSWNQCVNMKGIYSEKKRNFHSPKKKKIIREINALAKPLLSRIFCQKIIIVS